MSVIETRENLAEEFKATDEEAGLVPRKNSLETLPGLLFGFPWPGEMLPADGKEGARGGAMTGNYVAPRQAKNRDVNMCLQGRAGKEKRTTDKGRNF